MPHSICLQDWVTVHAGTTDPVQDEPLWMDIAGYSNIAVYADMIGATSQTTATALNIQSCPTRDEALFRTLLSYPFTSSSTKGPQQIKKLGFYTGLARYVRWSVTFPTSGVSFAFRIWLTLYQSGW